MCFLWKLCSCLNQYCCTWYPGSAAPQKTLFSWFMLKPFIENSKKSNYSLTKKKILTTQLGRVQQQKKFNWSSPESENLPHSFNPKKWFFTLSQILLFKSYSPSSFQTEAAYSFPLLFYSHCLLADSLWLPSSCDFFIYTFDRGRGKTHLHLHQTLFYAPEYLHLPP